MEKTPHEQVNNDYLEANLNKFQYIIPFKVFYFKYFFYK